MAKTLRLTVLTPERTALEADADFVLLRTVEGDLGVLHGHEPGAVQLSYGVLRAFSEKRIVGVLAVLGGFARIGADSVTVMTSFAETPDRFEEALKERERQLAENRALGEKAALELQRAEAAIRHTLVHLDISSYAIIKGHDEKPE